MTPIRSLALCLVTLGFVLSAHAESVQDTVRVYRAANEKALIDEYLKLVSIPDVSSDTKNCRLNAEFIASMLEHRGVHASLIEYKTHGVPPAVFGEIKVPGANRTVVLYAHYDGQPVNPGEWAPGLAPFSPRFLTEPIDHGGTIIEKWKPGDPVDPQWRLSGRAAADDKAGIMAIITAYEALAKSGIPLTSNIKFFFEGEEEIGSPHLAEVLENNRELLSSDLWIICDGPCHVTGRKMVVFGVRGDASLNLTVYGANRFLHSGHYGNWAPNPAWLLVDLLASMKDADGKVLVKGFYDDVAPLSPSEKIALAAIPPADEELMHEFGFVEPEVRGRSLLEGLQLPSLTIKAIQSAGAGLVVANAIPTSAKAALDLRLVIGNDSERQVAKVLEHIRSRGFTIIDHEPSDEDRALHARLIRVDRGYSRGYNAQRTSLDLPLSKSVTDAVQSTVDYPILRLPSMGASLPLITIEDVLGAKVLTVPIVNYDDNQHAANENLKIQFMWDGIETFGALLTMK